MAGIFGPSSPADDFTVDSFGVRGPAGLTAYQVAAAAGFAGTEAQWLASLQGAPADPTTLNAATAAANASAQSAATQATTATNAASNATAAETAAGNSASTALASATSASGSAASATTRATGAAASATAAGSSATAAAASAASVAKGQANGTAPLDANAAVPLANLQVRTAQVTRAARPAFVTAGGSFSAFIAALNPDATDGSWEAVYVEAFAPAAGILASLISNYLITQCSQTSSQAATVLASIWTAAALLAP